jgi:TRAP-type C4-dicarboxylate transport system permease small subunit
VTSIQRILDRVEGRLAGAAATLSEGFGWLYLVAALLISANVLARRFLGVSLFGITDLGGYLLAVGIAFGLAHTLATNGHIRVDVLIRKIPSVALRALLHTVALAALVAFAALLTTRAWAIFERSLKFGTRDLTDMQLPLAIPQALWLAGLAVFTLLAGVMLLNRIAELILGRYEEVDRKNSAGEAEEAEALVADIESYRDGGTGTPATGGDGRRSPQ